MKILQVLGIFLLPSSSATPSCHSALPFFVSYIENDVLENDVLGRSRS
jgi:hypothetical protein